MDNPAFENVSMKPTFKFKNLAFDLLNSWILKSIESHSSPGKSYPASDALGKNTRVRKLTPKINPMYGMTAMGPTAVLPTLHEVSTTKENDEVRIAL